MVITPYSAKRISLMDNIQRSTTYNLVSFNCKGVKRSVEGIRQLCRTNDIIALQETWLLPNDINYLSSINNEFACTGTSAVDTTAGMIKGRPYGGVALLWNKNRFQNVSVVQCHNVRICAIKVSLDQKSFLVFSIYMPTDNVVNLTEFTDCLGLVSAIISSENIESVYMLGDFNAHPYEPFYKELIYFCNDSEWICADVVLLGLRSDTCSFVSEANGSRRWLDHCVATKSAMQTITSTYIKYDVMWSDHYPLIIQCNFNYIHPKSSSIIKSSNKVKWGERKPEQIELYSKLCNNNLKFIDFPSELSNCCDYVCTNLDHRRIIDKMYSDIVDVLCRAARDSYLLVRYKKAPVVGWNRHVSAAHKEARSKFQLWLSHGKPSVGRVWQEMHDSRKIFKSRLKWCQNHSEQLKMDILASHHAKHDFSSFWKATNKLNSKPGLPVSVDGISEQAAIAQLFMNHFALKSPLGPPQLAYERSGCGQEMSNKFVAKDIAKVISSMSRGKSPGHDDLSIEHLKYAGGHLPRVLAMMFTLCIGHSYLPEAMMKTVVVPIVKNRTGDISDKNNYRPISLATIIAKVFDSLLCTQLDKYLQIHDNQFGFRTGLSTEAAVLCLKETVKYYTKRNTPIYACFLDLSRAFDLVSYDILWQKLVDIKMPSDLVNIFKYWYGNQINVVKWSDAYSMPYGMECGVRQGGLTSPKLFNAYMNALIEELSSTHVGCHIDEKCFNNISYADDMVLLSASVCGLSKLLGICESYARKHGLRYNTKKSECMVFRVKGKCTRDTPSIKLNGIPLQRVDQFKYLGHFINSDLSDNADIERERRALSVRANMIARRFARCSRDVKLMLFRAFCTSFYTSSLWVSYTQKQYNNLRVQYNNAFRVLMGLPRFCSASGMFAEARTDCFYTIMRKRYTSLLRRIRGSPNANLKVLSDRYDCQYLNQCCTIHLRANIEKRTC